MHIPSLGIVSDEVSLDFREAVQYGTSWGITRYELRCVRSGRVPSIDPAEIEEIFRTMREYNVLITALSPGVFKHPLSKRNDLERELTDVLPETFALARRFGVPLIIVFGFQRGTGERQGEHDEAVDFMRRAARAASDEGVRLAIENEPGFWCDTGSNTAGLIREVGSPSLGANWDPCNSYGMRELPFPEGYQAVKDVIFNVHVKDTKKGALVECVPVGEGIIDWKGQLEALARDEVVGHVTIETHCLPLIENSKRNVDTLRRLMSQISPVATT